MGIDKSHYVCFGGTGANLSYKMFIIHQDLYHGQKE